MKTIIFHGSPRKNQNSDTLVNYFIKGMNVKGDKEVRHFFINELNIKPCQGCLKCATSPNHSCAIKDDMEEIYSAYKKAKTIVFATPMYWGYMTAQLKIVFDRMEALAWEDFGNKIFVVIITYRHHCESTVAFFERIAPFFNIKLFIITCCTYNKDNQKDIPITMCQDQLEDAFQLGIKISTMEKNEELKPNQ
ncbi:MAG: flavodoxin family protein [Candidatus Lokiarchaeota archaeon]